MGKILHHCVASENFGQSCDGWRLQQGGQGELHAEPVSYQCQQPDGQNGMTAHRKEVVLDPWIAEIE
jgi:hypothetical protein